MVFLFAGLAGKLLHAVRGTVVVVETVVPRYEGVAVYLLCDAARHHELHPAVEDGVVILPSSVELLHLGNHALEGVERLSVPRSADDGAGDDLLSCSCKHLHDGTHLVEVLLAPQRHVIVSGNGIRVLPEVEVEAPLAWFGQHAVSHLQHDGQGEFLAVAVQGNGAFISSCIRISRHMYVEPDGTCRVGFHLQRLDRVEAVGKQEGVLAVLEDIGQDIADEVLLHGRSRDDVTPALEVADGERDILQLSGCSEDCLC